MIIIILTWTPALERHVNEECLGGTLLQEVVDDDVLNSRRQVVNVVVWAACAHLMNANVNRRVKDGRVQDVFLVSKRKL